jgi:hypothetical protein
MGAVRALHVEVQLAVQLAPESATAVLLVELRAVKVTDELEVSLPAPEPEEADNVTIS